MWIALFARTRNETDTCKYESGEYGFVCVCGLCLLSWRMRGNSVCHMRQDTFEGWNYHICSDTCEWGSTTCVRIRARVGIVCVICIRIHMSYEMSYVFGYKREWELCYLYAVTCEYVCVNYV